jgi:hypothetical protein
MNIATRNDAEIVLLFPALIAIFLRANDAAPLLSARI